MIEPLVEELKIWNDYFTSSWEGNIYYLGEKRKDLIGKHYNINYGWDELTEEEELEEELKEVSRVIEDVNKELAKRKRDKRT